MSLLDDLTRSIVRDPTSTDAMEVCADHLEELGDERAAYLRAQIRLRSASDDPETLRELRRLHPSGHREWLWQLERAGALESNLTGLPAAWWGQDLPGRPSASTYTRYSAEDLPGLPIDAIDPTLAWLRETPIAPGSPADACAPEPWAELLATLRARGLAIPDALVTLMTSPDLQKAIPSATANYFISADPSDQEVVADCLQKIQKEVGFLPFYSDQQSCVRWGLWLGESGESYAPVIAAGVEFGDEDLRYVDFEFAAPSVEVFVYRTWIENRIWFATMYEETLRDLLDFESAYLGREAR